MTSTKEQDEGSRISLNKSGGGRLELKKRVDTGVVRQSFSHGRSKSVAVEVKRKRAPAKPEVEGGVVARKADAAGGAPARGRSGGAKGGGPVVLKPLTDNEKSARVRALADAKKAEDEARQRAEENARRVAEESQRKAAEEEAAGAELNRKRRARRPKRMRARRLRRRRPV